MKNYLQYFLIAVSLLSCTDLFCQGNRLDKALDSYDAICGHCILLKERSLRGEQITPEELTSLLEQVSVLRSTLQKGSRNMSSSQKERFEKIKLRYTLAFERRGAAAGKPTLQDASQVIELPKVDWEPVPKVGIHRPTDYLDRLRYQWTFNQEPNKNDRQPLKTGILFLGGWRPSSTSYGGFFTLTGSTFGIYVKGRSSFQSKKADYSCNSDGTSSGHIIWTSGKESLSDFLIGAGGITRLVGPISIYAGSGYGLVQLFWEDTEGKWVQVEDYSAKGPCIDGGIIFSKGRLTASAGISTISLKTATIELGLGFSF